MVKTQVQIPDDLYREAKRVAEEKEWSFAETVRRGLEYITRVNPPGRASVEAWELPPGKACGPFLAPPEEWTDLAHE
jgi:hypothetical protein